MQSQMARQQQYSACSACSGLNPFALKTNSEAAVQGCSVAVVTALLCLQPIYECPVGAVLS